MHVTGLPVHVTGGVSVTSSCPTFHELHVAGLRQNENHAVWRQGVTADHRMCAKLLITIVVEQLLFFLYPATVLDIIPCDYLAPCTLLSLRARSHRCHVIITRLLSASVSVRLFILTSADYRASTCVI